MSWINLQGKGYNTTYFRRIYFEGIGTYIEYSNGDITVLYDLNHRERNLLIKIINNDSTTNS